MPGFKHEFSGAVTYSLLLRHRIGSEDLLLFEILVVLFLAIKEFLELELRLVVKLVDLRNFACNLGYVYHFFEINLFKGIFLDC